MKKLLTLTLICIGYAGMAQIMPSMVYRPDCTIYIGDYKSGKTFAFKDSCGWTIYDAGAALDIIIKSNHYQDSILYAENDATRKLLATTMYNNVTGIFCPVKNRKLHFKALFNYWKVTHQIEAAKKQYYKNKHQLIKLKIQSV